MQIINLADKIIIIDSKNDVPVQFNALFKIDLPITNNEADNLEINSNSWEGHSSDKTFTCNIRTKCYNLLYLTKKDKLYAFARINPDVNITISITTDLVAQSVIS
jgi:hypothetical protein